MEPVKGMVAAEELQLEFKKHLGCLGKEGWRQGWLEKQKVDRDQSNRRRQTVGQMASSVPKCSKGLRILFSTRLFYTKSELRRNQGLSEFFPGFFTAAFLR